MNRSTSAGFAVKNLSNLFRRQICETSDHLTGMQGWIIGYIFENSKTRDIYQRDIETNFNIRRSTVTGILQLMEKSELLTRQSVPNDGRLKKLILTEKAIKMHKAFQVRAAEIDVLATRGLTGEELEFFFEIMRKMTDNLNADSKNNP